MIAKITQASDIAAFLNKDMDDFYASETNRREWRPLKKGGTQRNNVMNQRPPPPFLKGD
jgi:hypothetical protein